MVWELSDWYLIYQVKIKFGALDNRILYFLYMNFLYKLNSFFKDFTTGLSKMLFHNIGLYKKHNCACHTYNDKGKRVLRS